LKSYYFRENELKTIKTKDFDKIPSRYVLLMENPASMGEFLNGIYQVLEKYYEKYVMFYETINFLNEVPKELVNPNLVWSLVICSYGCYFISNSVKPMYFRVSVNDITQVYLTVVESRCKLLIKTYRNCYKFDISTEKKKDLVQIFTDRFENLDILEYDSQVEKETNLNLFKVVDSHLLEEIDIFIKNYNFENINVENIEKINQDEFREFVSNLGILESLLLFEKIIENEKIDKIYQIRKIFDNFMKKKYLLRTIKESIQDKDSFTMSEILENNVLPKRLKKTLEIEFYRIVNENLLLNKILMAFRGIRVEKNDDITIGMIEVYKYYGLDKKIKDKSILDTIIDEYFQKNSIKGQIIDLEKSTEISENLIERTILLLEKGRKFCEIKDNPGISNQLDTLEEKLKVKQSMVMIMTKIENQFKNINEDRLQRQFFVENLHFHKNKLKDEYFDFFVEDKLKKVKKIDYEEEYIINYINENLNSIFNLDECERHRKKIKEFEDLFRSVDYKTLDSKSNYYI
jgi:hypothetical protein